MFWKHLSKIYPFVYHTKTELDKVPLQLKLQGIWRSDNFSNQMHCILESNFQKSLLFLFLSYAIEKM